MISKAYVQFVRISPRKVRYVIDMIRAKSVNQAQAILNGSPRRASGIVRKLLDQAVDAAVKNSSADTNNLFVSKVIADGGASMRRFRAASMGRASVIKKRTSHILLELDTLKKLPVSAPKTPVESTKTSVTKPKKSSPSAKGGSASGGKKTLLKKMAGAK